ncbi:dsDNA nuclease domain-containing protein [Pontibacillus litoralis]|uniref:CD-NTase associated protein 4-like DNA endonuclease domain-containing protein n=1 Tax=Pontibacillus litoralis JSM 072002 TaxID=1385512 RepID=A0A0A5HMS5_9BACI|nr:dsDNA nuclease domain-containing protein [Pontibacillus litoralis]KGX84917.1 hypothetical protein N784_11645 [Pontibacillus litoralis JSM 072002]
METTYKNSVHRYHLEKLKEYQEQSGENFEEIDEDEIINKLMEGDFDDLGGLTAIRGFVYQYYVAIYFILKMVQDPKTSWWDKVVFEYFDDVALLRNDKIRFIQVKTVRENSSNRLRPNDIYSRSAKKNVESNYDYFNSWTDKLFKNYESFINKKSISLIDNYLEKDSFVDPEFELVSNTPHNSLEDLEVFTLNPSFNADISNETILKPNIEKPIVLKDNKRIQFDKVFSKSVEFYLERLYINKLGSFDSLKKIIEGLIEDIIRISHPIKKTIVDEIFRNLLSEIVQRTYRDDSEMDKSHLVFKREDVQALIYTWCESLKDNAASYLEDSSLLSIIRYLLEALRNEFQEEFESNQKLLKELLETLDWFRTEFEEQFRNDSTYCLVFLNKLFNLQSTIKVEKFNNDKNKQHIKTSLSYIIRCLVFYPSKKVEFKNAQLLFHAGEIENEKLLFTIYNARNRSNTVVVKNTVVSALQQCDYGSQINQDLFSLILDEKKEQTTEKSETSKRLAARFAVTKVEREDISIIDPPENLKFINTAEVEDFFGFFSNTNEEEVPTFQNRKMENDWKLSLLEE